MRLEITRSRRRRKTVAARIVGDTLQVRAPVDLPQAELEGIIAQLKPRLEEELGRRRAVNDAALAARAAALNRRFFAGKLHIRRVGYVHNQRQRFGSCSPHAATIRISERVAFMPGWVRDYVLLHEMAHLLEPNHSARFWTLVNRYPWTERARGYLMGACTVVMREG